MTWGRCTKREHNGNTILYLSVFDWPVDGKLLVPGLKNEILSAKLLANGASLKTSSSTDGILVEVPSKALNTIATVIKIEVK